MKRAQLGVLTACLLGLTAAFISGCGSSSSDQSSKTSSSNAGKRGGELTFLAANDVDFLDPGLANYVFSNMILNTTSRTLYGYKPGSDEQVPDLAVGKPKISANGKTVTVKIREGVMFSPPVSREVTSKDVKYAIERGFTKNVANGYAEEYYGDIVGAPKKHGSYRPISGIKTPDKQTIVFELTKPTAVTFVQTLARMLTSPVPQEYARKFDSKSPSTYGDHLVSTGPYMIENNASGKLTGYRPGMSIKLLRNPNWKKETDFRPAHVDKITINEGNSDFTIASRRTVTGSKTVCCDGQPPAAELRTLQTRHKTQIGRLANGGGRWISLNTEVKPLDNLNVRKALVAVTDRNALRLSRGGAQNGKIAQHFLPPGIPGYEESGGEKGFSDLDFMANENGDMAVAKKYMAAARKEGVPINEKGMYTGKPIMAISSNVAPHTQTAEVVQAQFAKLGFNLQLRKVAHATMYTKFCGNRDAKVPVCPSVGWQPDFRDGQAVLAQTFDGNAMKAHSGSTWSQLDVPEINNAIARMKQIPLGNKRNKEWAKINHMITAQAPAIPFLWDANYQIWSKDVNAVMSNENGMIDLNFSSIK